MNEAASILKTKCIGLTGGIATGKSTTANLISQMGYTVIDADQISRIVTEKGEPAYIDIVAAFPEGIVDEEGNIDRSKLRMLIQSNLHRKKTLEGIVHPRISQKLLQIVENPILSQSDFFFYEAALIHETERAHIFKQVWCTHASAKTQIERLQTRNHLSEEAARSLVSMQRDNTWRAHLSDAVVDTSDSFEGIFQQISRLLNSLRVHG